MATIPQVAKQSGLTVDSEGNDVLPPDHRFTGWTVDTLLEQGDIGAARAELERLVEHGLRSGNSRPMDETLFDEIIASARSRARHSSR